MGGGSRRRGRLAQGRMGVKSKGPDVPALINHLFRRGGELIMYNLEVVELEAVIAPMGVDLGGQ